MIHDPLENKIGGTAALAEDRSDTPLLRVSNLRTWYHTSRGTARVVDGVSFTIGHGQIVGLVGESGSGKSQTALSIMGLIEAPGRIEPGSEVLFQGRDLTQLPQSELTGIRGRDISMIFQQPTAALNPVYTIGYQLVETLRAHENIGRDAARRRAIELLQLVGVAAPHQRISAYPHELSGGMCQRVMIATALACSPALLIADEPTTALDVTIQAQILDLLQHLQEQLKMAVLLITHDFGVIAEVADRVAVMYAGQIIEQGTTEEVLTNPQHPYTEALLRAVPLDATADDERLWVIPGTVPTPLAFPQGCRFAPRCRHAFEACSTNPPDFRFGDHSAACWLCESGMRSVQGVL